MSFRHKPRHQAKRILDIYANGEPIAYIAFNSQRSEEEGQFIWRTTKAFRKYRRDETVHKRYSHYMRDLKKCTAHCMEWIIFNTNSEASNIHLKEPEIKKQKPKKKTPPIVNKKLKESETLLEKIQNKIRDEDTTELPKPA